MQLARLTSSNQSIIPIWDFSIDLVERAILFFEPRIIVEEISITEPGDVEIMEGKIVISIDYVIPGTNTRNNFVFPFYLREADQRVFKRAHHLHTRIMAAPTKIQHPLLRRPGSSQPKRNADGFALQKDYTLIDGRSLGDLLDYIHQYARQVVFPELKIDEAGDAYAELSNWLAFFEKSLPFRLAQFGKKTSTVWKRTLLKFWKQSRGIPARTIWGCWLIFVFTNWFSR